jgi:glycogen(starch) synthase
VTLAEEKRGEEGQLKADFLFEVSWEVCNKVGGIYTVLKSKIPQTLKKYKDHYCLVGPYFHDKVKGEFEEIALPDEYKEGAEALKEAGIVPHYGKWLTEGNPNTLLLDFQPFFAKKDEIKQKLWEHFNIDSLHSPHEFDEPVVWAWAAGVIIESFFKRYKSDWKFVSVFHEWLSGAGILYLEQNKCNIGTIFVTHATVLGRSLANAGVDLYHTQEEGKNLLDTMDFDKEAYTREVPAKHQLEKACANAADVFATVSEITGIEAEHILQKKPDILVPNGLDLDDFPTIEENSIKHRIFRDKIYHFLLYYFFPYYHIDIDDTLIYFTASRYEMHDKGLDIFIKSLSKLNQKLKEEDSKKSIVAFFWVPSGVRGIKPEIVENKTQFKDVEDSLKDNAEHVMWRLLSDIVGDKPITKETIFEKAFLAGIKKKVMKFKREETAPPICTHDLLDPNDQIIKALEEADLKNSREDKVKVIFYPIYLTGADGLLDLTYYEAIQGSHMGVFPSFYEPWGYTPLESGALGVASITTDLAGYGRYIQKKTNNNEDKCLGICVLERMGKNDDVVVKELYDRLHKYTMLPKKKRIDNKLQARKLANFADWDLLIENYIAAHNMAIDRCC